MGVALQALYVIRSFARSAVISPDVARFALAYTFQSKPRRRIA